MKSSFPYSLMFGLFFCSIACQFGCDKPVEKVQDQNLEQPELSNGDNASVADIEKDGTQISNEAVDPSQHTHPNASNTAQSLFDGKSLDGWDLIEFGGEGDVEVIDGEIRMYSGDPLTGMRVGEDTELPTSNYEISLKAMKLEGNDFFCAITFPVNDTFCTLVVGGWGGTLVGLSNLDDRDASDNETGLNKKFEKNRWYDIRLQVLPERITAWIDKEKLIDQSIEGVEVSIRNDVISTTPLGITNFMTSSSLRDIKIRKLD